MKNYDVTLTLTITVKAGEEDADEEIINAYMAKLMNLAQAGELNNHHFEIEEVE